MKKILNAEQIRAADQYTITHEPVSSIDLMERAASAFVDCFQSIFDKDRQILIICGPGNNGGDGLAIGRLLVMDGYSVEVYLLDIAAELSPDCLENFHRLEQRCEIQKISAKDQIPDFHQKVVIDAMFGSGLNRPVKGFPALVIEQLNDALTEEVIAVDIPSGLFADGPQTEGAIVKANRTVTFQLPKLSFLIPETGKYVGFWEAVDIGLDQGFIDQQASHYFLTDEALVRSKMKPREKFAHKGDFGRVQVIAGSYGKMGAAVLCGKACLLMGAGLLTIHVPKVGYQVVQGVLPEAMTTVDSHDYYTTGIPAMENDHTLCIGPGLGKEVGTREAFQELLSREKKAMALDADALNLLAEEEGWMDRLPVGTILTPHVGEFERLFGDCRDGFERLDRMRTFSKEKKVIVVLKGAHSAISDEEGNIYFNTTGNPGMATGGSGDVLAGMITGLLAQGYQGLDAALCGVYVHGLAGDMAKKEVGEMSLVASNLLNFIPVAINKLDLTKSI